VSRLPVVSSPCDGCVADCCRAFTVVLHAWDAYRIARDLGVPLERFVELQGAPAPDENHQLVLDATAPPGERLYHRMVLLRVPDERLSRRCVFLDSSSGAGRCGIYPSRPGMCRAYPALVIDGALRLARCEHCPPGAWSLETLDGPLYRARYLEARRQLLIHYALVDGWNERVIVRREKRAPAELFAHLAEVCGALERRKVAWLAEPASDPEGRLDEEAVRQELYEVLVGMGWLG
jgi:Fe-S-cluster containining protein